jgi:hypothetical protein
MMDQELVGALRELLVAKGAHEKNAGWIKNLAEAVGKGVGGFAGRAVGGLPQAAWDATKFVGNPTRLRHYGRQGINAVMHGTGLNQMNEGHALNQEIQGNAKLQRYYDVIKAHAQARGTKTGPSLLGGLFSPVEALNHLTPGGQTQAMVEHLSDPQKLQRFLHGAPPNVQNAVTKLLGHRMPQLGQTLQSNPKGLTGLKIVPNKGKIPLSEHAYRGGHVGWVPHALPFAGLGVGLFSELNKEDPNERPYTISPEMGFRTDSDEPNGFERFMQSAGRRVSPYSPAIGNAMEEHPYISAAAGAGAAGAGLYGLHSLLREGDDTNG